MNDEQRRRFVNRQLKALAPPVAAVQPGPRPEQAHLISLYRRANTRQVEMFFHLLSRAKRTVHCLSGSVVNETPV